MATSNLVKTVATKQEDGTLGNDYKFGVSFNEVVDDRPGKTSYSLAQFFDNYISYMKSTYFVYRGTDTPKNQKIGLWIDTGHSNQDNLNTDNQAELGSN